MLFFFLNVNINVASSLVLKYTTCNYASYCQKKTPCTSLWELKSQFFVSSFLLFDFISNNFNCRNQRTKLTSFFFFLGWMNKQVQLISPLHGCMTQPNWAKALQRWKKCGWPKNMDKIWHVLLFWAESRKPPPEDVCTNPPTKFYIITSKKPYTTFYRVTKLFFKD